MKHLTKIVLLFCSIILVNAQAETEVINRNFRLDVNAPISLDKPYLYNRFLSGKLMVKFLNNTAIEGVIQATWVGFIEHGSVGGFAERFDSVVELDQLSLENFQVIKRRGPWRIGRRRECKSFQFAFSSDVIKQLMDLFKAKIGINKTISNDYSNYFENDSNNSRVFVMRSSEKEFSYSSPTEIEDLAFSIDVENQANCYFPPSN